MKFVIRRAVAGVVITPLVACGWVFAYASLILIGGEPSASVGEVFTSGLWLGGLLSVLFVGNSIWKLVRK